jgi:hypothetical protein
VPTEIYLKPSPPDQLNFFFFGWSI